METWTRTCDPDPGGLILTHSHLCALAGFLMAKTSQVDSFLPARHLEEDGTGCSGDLFLSSECSIVRCLSLAVEAESMTLTLVFGTPRRWDPCFVFVP